MSNYPVVTLPLSLGVLESLHLSGVEYEMFKRFAEIAEEAQTGMKGTQGMKVYGMTVMDVSLEATSKDVFLRLGSLSPDEKFQLVRVLTYSFDKHESNQLLVTFNAGEPSEKSKSLFVIRFVVKKGKNKGDVAFILSPVH